MVADQTVKNISDIDLAAFAIIASVVPLGNGISEYEFSREMDKSGYTGIAANIAIRHLVSYNFVERFNDSDYNGNDFLAYRSTDVGWKFLDKNISIFKMRKVGKAVDRELDDRIPF